MGVWRVYIILIKEFFFPICSTQSCHFFLTISLSNSTPLVVNLGENSPYIIRSWKIFKFENFRWKRIFCASLKSPPTSLGFKTAGSSFISVCSFPATRNEQRNPIRMTFPGKWRRKCNGMRRKKLYDGRE